MANTVTLSRYGEILYDQLRKATKGSIQPIVRNELAKQANALARGPYSRRAGQGISAKSAMIGYMDDELDAKVSFGSFSKPFKGSIEDSIFLIVQPAAAPQPSVFWKTAKKYPGVTTFAYWINEGKWMDLKAFLESGGQIKQNRPARPFVDRAFQNICSDNRIVSAILQATGQR